MKSIQEYVTVGFIT